MLVATSVMTDARVLREAGALVEAGHLVHIIGKDVAGGGDEIAGVQVSSASAGKGLRGGSRTHPVGRLRRYQRGARWLLLPQHRNLSFARWARGAEELADNLSFDVVHVHDFTALEVGTRLADRRRVPLVYDSHELWTQRDRTGRPTPFQRRRERKVERRLGARADAVITVGSALASCLTKAYGWQHVTVVRNTFPASVPRGGELGTPSGVIYAGRIGGHRDLETVAAASLKVDLPVRLIGPTDATWLDGFDAGRCTVHPPTAVGDVDALLRSAGLALVTLTGRSGNHRIALPNKLFHAVRAGVPVVASGVGELGRTVERYGLGVLYRPGDPESLAAAIEEVVARYADLQLNVAAAAGVFCWDADRRALLDLYGGLAR
jgi:glycosyltransferase involved in cell wall biosynthesis